jgi:beta-N-acetylhexosaminidase
MNFSTSSDFGNFIICGLSGTSLSDKDKQILEDIRPAGILFLKRNLLQDVEYRAWHEEFSKFTKDILRYSGRKKMLFTIDHEGGLVQRAPAPITNFGKPENYRNSAAKVAKAMTVELKSMGINLSWAPSADINTNPENPIIGKLGRAFSSSPEEVAKACVEFEKAMRENGIITCGKHFPGHGDTWSDSHLELPVVDVAEDVAMKRELLPFQALIDAGVPSIMTAHVLFKKIDPDNPATFSKKIISDILRGKMGFKGVVIADDINMLAIYDKIRSVGGAAQSINAGIDTYIVGRFPEPEKDDSPGILINFLKQALEKGLISSERLSESSKRVDRLLDSAEIYESALLTEDTFAKHQALAGTLRA